MERAVAIKKLGKLLGKSLGYRVDSRAPKPDERIAAKAALPAAIDEMKAVKEKRDARCRAILAADAEYQTLLIASNVATERVKRLSGMSSHYKFTAGVSSEMFFHVKAQGDSWEEVIAKLEA